MDGNFERRGLAEPDASGLLASVPDFEKIDGWLKLNAAELLFAAAASVNSGCIVEVGSYRGRSTVALCAGSVSGAKLPVYAIEPHENFVGMKGGVFGPSDRRAFFRTMLTTKFASVVRLVNLSSEVLSPGWDKPISLLFIDGDHRYEAVLNDFSSWRPHLIDHALVIFHDVAGTGPALLISDLQAEGALTHLQTVGRLAMFRFNAVDGQVDPAELPMTGRPHVYPDTMPPLTGPRSGQSIHAIGEHVYYSARGGYLYQAIPKCACTTIKTALLELEGLPVNPNPAKRHKKRHNHFPGTEALTSEEELAVLRGETDCFNFVMVRDPYSRMASSYADKIRDAYDRGGHHWIEMIEASAAAHGVPLSEKITFAEFVQVVSLQAIEEMDPHWRPQYHEGKFSSIKFDFIGRMEMIATDFAYILEQIAAPPEVMHRAIQPHNVTGSSLAMWSTVTADVRREFLRVFEIDFDTLRYPMRHASVLFSPVNQDRPKPQAFKLPNVKAGKAPKVAKRKERAALRALAESAPGDQDGAAEDADE